jgi:hypothetical protein
MTETIFFAERFIEIKEAYETLIDSSKRMIYDDLKNIGSNSRQNNSGTNFNPDIEYFKSNKTAFEYDEEVTFSWKTINADKVFFKPFGAVQPIGQKIYKIKDFKNPELTFELIAENTNIDRLTKSSLILINKTYYELYDHFKKLVETNNLKQDNYSNYQQTHNTKQKSKVEEAREQKVFDEATKAGEQLNKLLAWFLIVLIGLIILFIFWIAQQ